MSSLYERVGGTAYFEALVDRFYDGVSTDPVLRPLYPEGDLSDERRWLALFLVQYWGGPDDYSEARGHPRLRMRHFPFAIGPAERDAWLRHMRDAIAWTDPPPAVATRLLAYVDMAAEAMRNRD